MRRGSRAVSQLILTALIVAGGAACSARPSGTKTAVSAAQKGAASAVASRAMAKGTAPIRAGQTVSGAIERGDDPMDDGSHYDTWTYSGTAGEKITVTMASDEIDSYLMVLQPVNDGFRSLAEDDDGAGDLNSKVTVEIPATGEIVVVANTAGSEEFGSYRLQLASTGGGGSQPPVVQSPVRPAVGPGQDPQGRYAVLVGINDYPGTESDLDGPVQDALIMRDVLINRYGFQPENVLFLKDEQATRDNIIAAFQRHLSQAGPDGVAVFYYSGHGTQLEQNTVLAGGVDPETDNVDEALYVWSRTDEGGLVIDDEIGALADQLPAKQVLMILDACYSGTGSRANVPPGVSSKLVNLRQAGAPVRIPEQRIGPKGAPSAPRTGGPSDVLTEPARHVLLAASSDKELSWTARGWPDRGGVASVFTYYLAEELERAGPNATFEEVMQQVRQRTLAYTTRRYEASQTPQAEGLSKGQSIRSFLQVR